MVILENEFFQWSETKPSAGKIVLFYKRVVAESIEISSNKHSENSISGNDSSSNGNRSNNNSPNRQSEHHSESNVDD